MIPARLLLLIAATLTVTVTVSVPARAGRPLATDDAATADTGTCQLETWVERASGDGALVLAPACGVVDGLEVDADYAWPKHRDRIRASAGLALKWVPASWHAETPFGALTFGLKIGITHDRPAGGGWRGTGASALALASLQASEALAAHADLGVSRDRSSGTSATRLNLALVWTPHDLAQVFAEVQLNNRHAVFGSTVTSAGGRRWLVKDRFGLDLTASRHTGSGEPTQWTLGFGWYGLSF